MATISLGAFGGGFDLDELDLAPLAGRQASLENGALVRIVAADGWAHEFSGQGFQQSGSQIVGGSVNGYSVKFQGLTVLSVAGLSLAGAQVFTTVLAGDTAAFLQSLFGGADTLTGSSAGETFRLGAGDDWVTGLGGLDLFDGGSGRDTAAFSGLRASYRVTSGGPGVSVLDLRTPSADGRDVLFNFEALQFADATLDLSRVDGVTQSAYGRVLRADHSGGFDVALDVGNGLLSRVDALARMADAADATTSVATLAYAFFTGGVPTLAGLDYLVSSDGPNPNSLNSAYYQSFNLENRYINFAVNLGKLGEGSRAFAERYGGQSLFEATRVAYAEIFGARPSDEFVHALLDPVLQFNNTAMTRAAYFAHYGQDGPEGIGAKAAMVGWLLAEAAKADVGLYARANEAFLTDLGLNNTAGVDLIGVYGRPEYVYTSA
ncbi:hypothetical protein [Phenylobacterium sp.]|uniref:hypothetical protein n=1 Tax=Phenylobacterium sp. TaxID=1871053 RepID=UPI002F928140